VNKATISRGKEGRQSGYDLTEVTGMSTEGEQVYDPVLGKVLTRLKKTAQQLQQEGKEKNRCVQYAEEILREASRLHP
jgi:hypothetical protein